MATNAELAAILRDAGYAGSSEAVNLWALLSVADRGSM
jgi:hypothetical protein